MCSGCKSNKRGGYCRSGKCQVRGIHRNWGRHIAVALMDQYLQQLNLEVVEGRAAIAQHLHAVAPGDSQAEDGRACDLEVP